MQKMRIALVLIVSLICIISCELNGDKENELPVLPPVDDSAKIIFLHHSTGNCIWGGGVENWFLNYNTTNSKNYQITPLAFPKEDPYGWNNYPYDYWNIWVQHAGNSEYMQEPTLEILTSQYHVIIFKHCFPVSGISADSGDADVTSSSKEVQNYKLQYEALKEKMHSFPNNRFIVWTGAALTQASTDEASATRARDFFSWVKNTWDEDGDNISVWDFWQLETGGGLYILPANATDSTDSHPNSTFSHYAAALFSQRIVDVIEGRGDTASLTGE